MAVGLRGSKEKVQQPLRGERRSPIVGACRLHARRSAVAAPSGRQPPGIPLNRSRGHCTSKRAIVLGRMPWTLAASIPPKTAAPRVTREPAGVPAARRRPRTALTVSSRRSARATEQAPLRRIGNPSRPERPGWPETGRQRGRDGPSTRGGGAGALQARAFLVAVARSAGQRATGRRGRRHPLWQKRAATRIRADQTRSRVRAGRAGSTAASAREHRPRRAGELRWSSERPNRDGSGWYPSEAGQRI
jgi:hypothetical protein